MGIEIKVLSSGTSTKLVSERPFVYTPYKCTFGNLDANSRKKFVIWVIRDGEKLSLLLAVQLFSKYCN